jgi:hypothetical protein
MTALITAAVSIRQDRQKKFDLIQAHLTPANRLQTVLHSCGNTKLKHHSTHLKAMTF